VFVGFSGARWFSRAANMLSVPERSVRSARAKHRQVVLYVHLTDAALAGVDPVARLERGDALVTAEQVRSWCGHPDTAVTVKPVIDLHQCTWTDADHPSAAITEHVTVRDRTCVFPWCTRPARGCDIDHVDEHDHHADAEGRPQPGPTQSNNLAALCRFHHRLKTHTAWLYRMTAPGVVEWTSPHGHTYRRDRTGTTPIEPSTADPPDIPRPRRP